MIEFLSDWAKSLGLAIIVISILEMLLPNNKTKKYEAILNNASTLYIDPSYDITDEIVDLLNKRYVKK